jgi:ribosomal protein S18 acetylase RimI-like enzyme
MEIIRLNPVNWEKFKELRLEALKKDSLAFGSSYEEAIKKPDDEWKKQLENPGSYIFVAKENDDYIGMAAAYQEEGEKCQHIAYIWGVYVREADRKKGIGRQLMETILLVLKNDPVIEKVNLNVNTKQIGAVKLYESLGFEVIGTAHRELKISGEYYDEHAMEIFFTGINE